MSFGQPDYTMPGSLFRGCDTRPSMCRAVRSRPPVSPASLPPYGPAGSGSGVGRLAAFGLALGHCRRGKGMPCRRRGTGPGEGADRDKGGLAGGSFQGTGPVRTTVRGSDGTRGVVQPPICLTLPGSGLCKHREGSHRLVREPALEQQPWREWANPSTGLVPKKIRWIPKSTFPRATSFGTIGLTW